MSYVDGFIVAVPKKKIPVYLKMARLSAKVWREHSPGSSISRASTATRC